MLGWGREREGYISTMPRHYTPRAGGVLNLGIGNVHELVKQKNRYSTSNGKSEMNTRGKPSNIERIYLVLFGFLPTAIDRSDICLHNNHPLKGGFSVRPALLLADGGGPMAYHMCLPGSHR